MNFANFKHALALLACVLLITVKSNGQDQFRKDFNCLASFDPETEKWSDWQIGNNTIVFNVNTNSDFKLFKHNGEIEVYRKVGKIKTDFTSDGKKYQIMLVLDEDGNEIVFQYFENGDAKLILKGGYLIQLSNCD